MSQPAMPALLCNDLLEDCEPESDLHTSALLPSLDMSQIESLYVTAICAPLKGIYMQLSYKVPCRSMHKRTLQSCWSSEASYLVS